MKAFIPNATVFNYSWENSQYLFPCIRRTTSVFYVLSKTNRDVLVPEVYSEVFSTLQICQLIAICAIHSAITAPQGCQSPNQPAKGHWLKKVSRACVCVNTSVTQHLPLTPSRGDTDSHKDTIFRQHHWLFPLFVSYQLSYSEHCVFSQPLIKNHHIHYTQSRTHTKTQTHSTSLFGIPSSHLSTTEDLT